MCLIRYWYVIRYVMNPNPNLITYLNPYPNLRYVIRYVMTIRKTLITYLNPTYLWCFSPPPKQGLFLLLKID